MRFCNLYFFITSAVIGSPLLDERQNILKRSLVLQNAEESNVLRDDAQPDLNIAFTGTGASVNTRSDVDFTDTLDLSLISSPPPDLNGDLDLNNDASLDFGDIDGSTDEDDRTLNYPLDSVDNIVLSEKQNSCGSASTSPATKMRRDNNLCTDPGTATKRHRKQIIQMKTTNKRSAMIL